MLLTRFLHFGKVNSGNIYKNRPRKEWATSNCQVRLLHETEALRSSSGIAPCTECITSGLKATGSPPSLCSHGNFDGATLGRLKVNLSQVGFFTCEMWFERCSSIEVH